MSIVVMFGGKSCEHSISVVTGVQLLNAISSLNPVPIYIQPDGSWVTGKELFDISYYKKAKRKKLRRVHLLSGESILYCGKKRVCEIECAVLALHGLNGEDGSLQGLLTLSNIPYTGSGIVESGVCLDKVLMKKVLRESRLPLLPYVQFNRDEFNRDTSRISADLEKLGDTYVVKPARLGSSIGVALVHNEKELVSATRTAFSYDNKVLVERGLVDFTELNVAVLGRGDDLIVSEVEKPIGWKDILSFKDKYGGAKSSGKREFPANIPQKTTDKIKALAVKAFKILGLSGVVRIDFMLDSGGKLWLNEINTIPGSLSTYLFKPQYSELDIVKKLIQIAKAEHHARERLTYAFNASLFSAK